MNTKQITFVFLCGIASWLNSLYAADYTWMSEPANGIWSTTHANWNAGEAWPVDPGHTAVFGASSQQMLSVGEALNVGAIRFQADGYQIAGESLTFIGETPFLAVESASVTSLLETAIFNDSLLTKTGPGVLRLGAAVYVDGATNVRNVVVADGVLRVEEGRNLCSIGAWSVAGGATYEQHGGTNILLSGGDILVLGEGGETGQTARFEVTNGVWHAKATRASDSGNSRVALGGDQDAWLRVADSADVWAMIVEMTGLATGKSATLQLDGGTLTVARMTGSGGSRGTTSRILLNGTDIWAERSNSAFISGMTEALVQAGGLVVTVPTARYFKTAQLLKHDPALGEILDGGLIKRGYGPLHLQKSNTYTGTNRIEQGTVVVEADQALGYGPIKVGPGGDAASIAAAGGLHTLTNRITFGLNGSVCALDNAMLTLTDIGFVPDKEQLKVGGTHKGGTVCLAIDPASTTLVNNIFVYDNTHLMLDGGTVIRQLLPTPAGVFSPRVEVRAGSVMTVREADIQMPDSDSLALGGGEYRQEGGIARFPHIWGTVSAANADQPEVPSRVNLAGGELTFTSARMNAASSRRSTETIINGGVLKAAQLNLSKPTGADTSLTHRVELNGGTLEVGEIRYDGGDNAVEPATILFNGGTLKTAGNVSANNFISFNDVDLFSLYLGAGGLICDTAGENPTINQPMHPDPDLDDATDGGILKTGAGCLALTQTLETGGPVVVAEGELTLFDLRIADTNVIVEAEASLTLCGGTLSNVLLEVNSGGTLIFANTPEMEQITNGSFEDNTWGDTLSHEYLTTASTDVPGWTFLPDASNEVGIQKNGSGFTTTVPVTTNGYTTAVIKKGTVKTTVSTPWKGMYLLRFEHAMRYGYKTAPTVDVLVDNIQVHQIVYPGYDHGYEALALPLVLSLGTHEIAFKGDTSGYSAVFIDAVSLTGVGADALVIDATSELHVAPGATLVLDNESPVYIEQIYLDGQQVYNMNTLRQNGVTVEGQGRLKTAQGGTVLQLQ